MKLNEAISQLWGDIADFEEKEQRASSDWEPGRRFARDGARMEAYVKLQERELDRFQ